MKKIVSRLLIGLIAMTSLTACQVTSQTNYTVTWQNYDGSILEVDEDVPYGSMPSYDGETPRRDGDNQYSYTFVGWSPDVSEVVSDVTYVAQFSSSVNSYTVTWEDYDGTVLEIDYNVPYGSMPNYDGEEPIRYNTTQYTYNFSGWSPKLSRVIDDVTYVATYDSLEISSSPGLVFDFTGDGYTVTGLIGDSKQIMIPAFYNDEPVIAIGQNAFKGLDIETVRFAKASKLTLIEDYAFADCAYLTSIYIPSSVTYVGWGAFSNCSSLTLYCGASSKPSRWNDNWNSDNRPIVWSSYLGIFGTTRDGFNYIAYIDSNNEPYISIIEYTRYTTLFPFSIEIPTTIEDIIVKDIGTTFKNSSISSIKFDEDSQITHIVDDAFRNCSSLTSINIPSSVTSIGSYAFYWCQKLRKVTIPEDCKLTTIGESAFEVCSYLDNIYISSSVTTIGESAFSGCSSLTSINIPSSVITIGKSAFSHCYSLTSFYISSSVTTIGIGTFSYCPSLVIYCEVSSKPSGWDDNWNNSNRPVVWNYSGISGEMSNGLIYAVSSDEKDNKYIVIVGYDNSEYPDNPDILVDLVVPSSIDIDGISIPVKKIASSAFYRSYDLKSISIPSSIDVIDISAFAECYSLTTVNIASDTSLTTIGDSAFQDCYSLTSIYIPNSVTSIGEHAFDGCENLTTVTISENSQLESIGSSAFSLCTSLTSVTFAESSQLESIGDSAFYSCTSLTSIYIPSSVSYIGWDAFSRCTSLTVYCEASSKPRGWSSSWNSSNCPVNWGYTYEQYLEATNQ